VTSRKIYRTVINRGDVLTVLLRLENGQEYQGQLLDVNITGAAVAFPARQVRKLLPGARGAIGFSAPGGRARLSVAIQVQSMTRMGDTMRVSFHFTAEPEPENGWNQSLRALFNRRSAFRVEPRFHEPINVRVRADGCGPERGQLVDMSLTGMAVALEGGAPEGMAPSSLVRLSFQLPEAEVPMMLGVLVRGVLRTIGEDGDEQLRLGVQFRHDLGRRFLSSRSELRRFVMDRQREDLRQPRDEKQRRKTDR
jgi:c-di-GMP-binding flagellar brake protein YcgR